MSPVEGAHSLAHVTRMVAGAKSALTLESPGKLPLEVPTSLSHKEDSAS